VKRRAAVSIAELLADGVPVHPAEAVAVVRRLCASVEDHPSRVSHPTEIVLLADGELLTGTHRERRMPVTAVLAALLRSLLDRAPLGHRAPAVLFEVIARHVTAIEPDREHSARALAADLEPFEGQDPKSDLRALFARWRAVADLGSEMPGAGKPAQLPRADEPARFVVLRATESVRRSVLVRKPDRRRYERVALSAANAPDAVLRLEAIAPPWGYRALGPGALELRRAIARAQEALTRAQEHRGVRDLAIASALLLTVVPTGWWLSGSVAIRPPRSSMEALEPEAMAAHAAVRELDPDTSIDPMFLVRPELISTRSYTLAHDTTSTAVSVATAAEPVVATTVGPDVDRAGQPSTKTPLRRLRRSMPSAFWFPDGKRIGYNRGSVLEIVEVKSGRTRAFSTPRRSRIGMVAVSPDGRRLVFNAGREGSWLLDLSKDDRKQMRRLIADPTVRSFVWSPDGKRIAYYSRRKGDWQVIQR
jgi:hypothetical protein